jgi:hypothetical protein
VLHVPHVADADGEPAEPTVRAVTDPAAPTPDYRLAQHGSVCLLWALHSRARRHLFDRLGDEAILWGDDAVAVEPRYAVDVCMSLARDGFAVAVPIQVRP